MPTIIAPRVPDKDDKPETKEFVLKPGNRHVARDQEGNLVRYEGGEKVALTEFQYGSFQDKFLDPDEAGKFEEEQRRQSAEQAKQQENAARRASEGQGSTVAGAQKTSQGNTQKDTPSKTTQQG